MVNFVGAGPGACDLITLRGKKLIEEADVIIYAGSLVNPELLKYAGDKCELHNSAHMTLEEVIEVIERAEKNGKNTVRLHTGDPSLYGAIKEQMDVLSEKGIEYAVCPGVSSLFGAAAALKAEFTLPDVSQSLIITRTAGRTPVPPKEDIALMASHNTSMAVFLSASMVEELSKKLIDGGYSPETPAALVYKATWEDEKTVLTDIKNLACSAKKNGINKTALILVGGFLGSEYERSKLYDSEFTHGYRKGKEK